MSVIMPAFEHVSLNTMGLLWRLIGKKDQGYIVVKPMHNLTCPFTIVAI